MFGILEFKSFTLLATFLSLATLIKIVSHSTVQPLQPMSLQTLFFLTLFQQYCGDKPYKWSLLLKSLFCTFLSPKETRFIFCFFFKLRTTHNLHWLFINRWPAMMESDPDYGYYCETGEDNVTPVI